MKKKLFISIFSLLLPAINLPLFVSCSTIGNQDTNNNNSNADNYQPSDIPNNETDKNEKDVADIVNQVNTKYYVDKNSNKLFFLSAITSSGSDLASTDINNIKNVLFPKGNWSSQTNGDSTTYEAKNFNDVELFRKFLKYGIFTNKNSNGEFNLDINDINCNVIANPNNINGFFEIVVTKISNIQRDIFLIVELAKGKSWKSNLQNYSIIFTYVQTIFN